MLNTIKRLADYRQQAHEHRLETGKTHPSEISETGAAGDGVKTMTIKRGTAMKRIQYVIPIIQKTPMTSNSISLYLKLR